MTILYADPLFLRHETGRHPETPNRLRSIMARLGQAALIEKCSPGTYQPLSEEAIAELHAPGQIKKVRELARHGGGAIDPDTVVSPDSFEVACAAAGACVSAVDAVLTG